MARNCLRINHQGNSIQLCWQRGESNPLRSPAVKFEHPFDEQALADLRWYLQDYLHSPDELASQNAARIEQNLQAWGKQLFELVFSSSDRAHRFFRAATFEGLQECELVITSDSPQVLNLPWELIYNPNESQFLAFSFAGISRSLTRHVVLEMSELPQDQLNILLVIARPDGEQDIALQTIPRSILDSLSHLSTKVNIKILRPPSFEEFEEELNANPGLYHVVHFDGYSSSNHTLGAEQGVLVFEAADGSPQIIAVDKIAQHLADYQVPIFVLSFGKMPQQAEDNLAFVAARLASLGAKGVVAIAYSVYPEAAKHFMGQFYGMLAAGKSLSTAVTAGRREVLNQPQRHTPTGNQVLQDWLVPMLYQQESYQLFTSAITNTDALDMEKFLEQPVNNLVGFPEESAYGLIGRDYDILRIERAFCENNIVLLQGAGGVGKTELACGLARWLNQTQGRSGKIFYMSFEHGATLNNVVNQIGREVWRESFSLYPPEEQLEIVMKYLYTVPCLLIWDSFESVAGLSRNNDVNKPISLVDTGTKIRRLSHSGNSSQRRVVPFPRLLPHKNTVCDQPLLSAAERDNLHMFLQDLHGGKSWVLITSCCEEAWLDCDYTLLNLGGLPEQNVEELATKILQTVGVDKSKMPPEYLDLLTLLGCHPLSLRMVLPHLKTQTPLQLITALQQEIDAFEETEDVRRNKYLTVSLNYTFAKLSHQSRQHLPFLALFSERVDAVWLQGFSESSQNEYGLTYQAVFRENLSQADWLKILNEAVAAGILEHLGETIYKIHPAVSWYLRQRLAENYTPQDISNLEKKLLLFYTALADGYRKQLTINPELASFVLQVEEPNLLQNLRLAEQQEDWAYAQAILEALGKMYSRIGRKSEFKFLQQRAWQQIGKHLKDVKTKGEDAFDFWMYLRLDNAKELLQSSDLKTAGVIYQEILDQLISLNEPSLNNKIATINQNLGDIAQKEQRLKEAIAYYQQALRVYEEAEECPAVANIYHQLGNIAQKQQRFGEAIAFYQKALQIYVCEDTGDLYSVGNIYHQLGNISQAQQQFDEAIAFYQKALQIYENARDFHSAADVYHQLAIVTQQQQQFDEAIAFCDKALQIYEDARDFHGAAAVYHQLARLTQQQQQFDEAIACYQKALQFYEDTGNVYCAATVYHQLGTVAQEQGHFEQATACYQKALKVYENTDDFHTTAGDYHHLGEVAKKQENFESAVAYFQKAFEYVSAKCS